MRRNDGRNRKTRGSCRARERWGLRVKSGGDFREETGGMSNFHSPAGSASSGRSRNTKNAPRMCRTCGWGCTRRYGSGTKALKENGESKIITRVVLNLRRERFLGTKRKEPGGAMFPGIRGPPCLPLNQPKEDG